MPAPTSQAPAEVRASGRPATSLGVLPELASAGVRVHQGRCVEVRNRHASCHRCADACASGAIAFEDGRLRVNPDLCISCGTCATVCPTCALEAADPTDDEFVRACRAAAAACGGRVVIGCAHMLVDVADAYDPDHVACVGCLGLGDVTLACGDCDACEHVRGREVADEVTACAQTLVDAWGGSLSVTFARELPAECLVRADVPHEPVFDVRRAGVMARPDEPAGVGGPAADAPVTPEGEADGDAARPQKVGRDGTLPHFVPTRRGRLLASLGEMGPAPEQSVETRLWASVFIDPELCGSCRMCAVFCPTGALRKFDDRVTATFGVEHLAGLCVGCRCCEDVCPHHAVTVLPEVFPSDLSDDHAERFEMRPRDVEPGRTDALEKRMRGLLSGSRFVNYA